MKWNPQHRDGEGTPLDQLKIPKGNWEYSPLLEEVLAAKEWGLTPSQFWALPDQEQAIMIASIQTVGVMRSWEDYLDAKKIEAERASLQKRD